MKKYGSRQEVWNNEAEKTRGGLQKDDLILSKTGRIVSKKKSLAAAASYAKFGFQKRAAPVVEEATKEQSQAAEPKPKKRKRRAKKKSE